MTFENCAARLAGLAARALGWRPDEFWRATPSDLALALGVEAAPAPPPSRAELQRMMERDGDGRSDR
ncbi:phage tail assembly chaperone [Qipengyuania sp.]|uniref:phage tail assembly chaperone n=1 Tax=Qipengyuania sp. TaxID=2004515 RepID=UPI0035C7E15F